MYAVGRGGQQDIEQARHWLEKAAAQGHKQARLVLEEVNAAGKANADGR